MAETMKCQWCDAFRESGYKSGRQEMAAEVEKLTTQLNRMRSLLVSIKHIVDFKVHAFEYAGWISHECGKAITASDRSAGGEGKK